MGFFTMKMKNIFKIVFVIIGTMVGAGFASGQEVYLFFFSYGIEGLIGLIISGLIMGFVIYQTLRIVNQYGASTYKEFLDLLIRRDRKIKPMINGIINLFILITFFIMIAGFGAYFEQELGINSIIGSSILAITTFFIFMTSVKGVVKANELLVPILIGFLVIIGMINLKDIHIWELGNYIIKTNESNFILSAILYSSYNSILLIPVLLTLKNYMTDKKQILKIAIISALIIIVLSIIVFLLLVRIDVDITLLEMPAVYVVSKMFVFFKYVYGFIILGSIFTTSISLGTSFLQNISKNKKSYTQIAILMCITSILVSKIGFSNLINLLYPVFGYLGILQILKLTTIKK